MQLNKADLRFITALSAQVAGAIYNVRLLDEARRRALQLQTAVEIARDISSLLDLDELLAKAVTLVRERFSFYHVALSWLILAASTPLSARRLARRALR